MHPFRSAGVVGTARKEGDTGNRGRPVAGEGSGLNVTSGGGAGGNRNRVIVCAGQHPDRVGWSPTGARVGGAISKSGGNASLAGVS